jgi:membrane protein YdbS with pleckstrin-like domain
VTAVGGPGIVTDWSGPSPRLAVLRRSEAIVSTVLVLAAVVAVELAASAATVVLASSLAVVVVLGALSVVVLGRRVRAWGYAERDDDLLVRRGVMLRRLSVIPYGRMQFVDVTAGPLERAFGLSTVRMHTAAAASDARIPGLAGPEADRLRDRLTILGEARAAGL